jgi:RHS repeat-associated protein
MNLTYNYMAGSDNGKIASMTDAVSGETVSYAYDSLNRLISATAKSGTTTVWGNSFGFDGFGNLLSKTVTGGSAPTLSQTVNTATNHINAYTYDSNGNQTTVPVAGSGNVNAGYDLQNRMALLGSVGSPTAQYAYGAANQRVWRMATESGTTKEWFYFYGIDGQRMASYQVTVVTPVQGNSYTSAVTVQAADVLVYFGRKTLMEGSWNGIGSFSASYVGVDRLGSIPGGAKLFAWGEEVTVTGNDKIKFATYLRDGDSGIDYGMNRYYGSGVGRFLSVDRSWRSVGTFSPQTWNRYSYVVGDPANADDPDGLLTLIIGGFGDGNPGWGQIGTPFNTAVSKYFGEQATVWTWSGCDGNFIAEIIGFCYEGAGQALAKFIAGYHFAPGEKLNIVAHSQGGNVVKAYTNVDGAHIIDTLITLGTPQRSDFTIDPNEVRHYFNVYSANDWVQPLGGPLERIVTVATLAYDLPYLVDYPDWGIDLPCFNLCSGIGTAFFEIYFLQGVAGRTDDFADNIEIDTVPGIGAVGHSDLHSVQVWNDLISIFSASGFQP